MLSVVQSVALHGLNGYLVNIQVDVSAGMPTFEIVGLPDASIRESKERIKTAIKNSTLEFLSRKIIVNLAPASTRKEGSIFDLPIAIGILIATGFIYNFNLKQTIFIGELSLDGSIGAIKGILPICIEAKRLGIKKIILPEANSKEVCILKDIEIIPVSNLNQIIAFLNNKINIPREKPSNFIYTNFNYDYDFSDVKGQENVKRALKIAASGGHNCLLIRKSWFRENYVSSSSPIYFTRFNF